ncbi:MAG: RNB domain-containing ribonuclease, partial [Candidatus Promineifilaceae bacterium]
MTDVSAPPTSSLVVYKNRPARVTASGKKKIEIETADGQNASVRPKDVMLLHPGPLTDFAQLGEPNGEVITAWELLQGETTNLAELAELAFGELTPAVAWAVWQLLEDDLYFGGALEAITVHDAEYVAAERAAREAKEAEAAAWQAFLSRMAEGRF